MADQRAVVSLAEMARSWIQEPALAVPIERPLLPAPALEPPGLPAAPAPESDEPPMGSLEASSPEPVSSFMALGDVNTAIPPDTIGAVGPNHLMTTLNTQVRIQDRSGGVISTVSLNQFWASLNNPSTFDPKVVYDPYGGRFIFTALANAQTSNSATLIGVSATSDPTGTWYLYRIDADAANLVWADYPSLGFNKKWIAVQVNMFQIPNTTGAFRSEVLVFDKADLYAHGSGDFTRLTLSNAGGVQAPAVTMDPNLETLYLLQDYNGNSGGSGYLRLYTITGSVNLEVLTPGAFISRASPWAGQPTGGVDFAPQKGSTSKIQNNDSRLRSVMYRNGSLWAAQTVFLPATVPTRAAAQWWQVSTAGAIQQFGRVEDPTGATFYAFPTIAANRNNDALMGYTMFSAQIYASAAYSFRSASDPANTMQDPLIFKAGEAPYYKTFTGARNRWGDFSGTVVDPLNDVDMWTIQEYAAAPAGGIDRWGTWWARVSPNPPNPPAATTEAAANVTAQEATLRGTVNPNGSATQVYFEWGLSDTYGNTTPQKSAGSGTSAVSVTENLTGLVAARTYHYRLVAVGPGGTVYGADRTFTTRFLITHAAAALRVAGGLTKGSSIEVARMDVVKTGTSAGKVRLDDAVAIARNAMGLG